MEGLLVVAVEHLCPEQQIEGCRRKPGELKADIAEALLAKDANRNARDNEGKSPADVAGQSGHKELQELLRPKVPGGHL